MKQVPSDHDGSVTYNVRLLRDTCNCKLCCINSDTCIHMYACTCMDSMLNATVCKHVHLVKVRTTAKVSATVSHTSTMAEYFTSHVDEKCNDQLSALRQQVCKLNDITVLVTGCHNSDVLKTSKHLNNGNESYAEYFSTIYFTYKKKSANRNSEKQQHLFSTKKKPVCISLKLTKPSQREVQESPLHLLSQTTTCYRLCLQEDDISSNDLVNCVQCFSCEVWLHAKCATGETNPLHM